MTAVAETSESAEPRKDFFISYNRADRAWAEWIAWQLEEAKYTTVLQAWDFRPGGNFVLDMQRAAAQAERTIAVLSEDFLASAFTQPEWAAAFAQDPTGEKGILVPVRVRTCDPRGLFRAITYVDLVNAVNAGDETAAREALLAGVQRGRRKPAAAPAFPHGATAPRSVRGRPRFPGALPSIWNVPHLRNPNFTGREELLAQLRSGLTSGRPAAVTQAITGLGGVGKTQLATEYAYHHASEYDLVWWVRAEEPAILASDYALLANELDLPEQNESDQAVIAAAVQRWLRQHQHWLLVFDNAREPAEVRPYLPQGGAGHVLVTSRNPMWGGVTQPVPVRVLGREEAVAFLLKRTGQADEPTAARLAATLGDLPLALEQAGAYMEAKGRSLAEYEQLFRTHQQELLRRGPLSADYPATVATTWELAFQQVAEASPAGSGLLHLCAFLAPDDIPRDLLSRGAEYLPQPLAAMVADPLAFDDAMGILLRYSLIEASAGVLAIHRLVQAMARDRLDGEARLAWAEAAVRLVNATFPDVEVRTWPTYAQLMPHALTVSGHAQALHVAEDATGRLLNQVGSYLRERAQSTGAKSVYERALAIREQALGPDHPDTAQSLSNLGVLLQDQGDLAGARPYLERALAICGRVLGPNHPTTLIVRGNLQSLRRRLSRRGSAVSKASGSPDAQRG